MNSTTPPPQPETAAIALDAAEQLKTGPLPTSWDEARHFPRFFYRAEVTATVYPRPGADSQEPVRCSMLTRDLSRGGLNVLYTDQLFPGQQIDLVLTDGASRRVEVMWCRRLAERRYSLGCRFVKTTEGAAGPAEATTSSATAAESISA